MSKSTTITPATLAADTRREAEQRVAIALTAAESADANAATVQGKALAGDATALERLSADEDARLAVERVRQAEAVLSDARKVEADAVAEEVAHEVAAKVASFDVHDAIADATGDVTAALRGLLDSIAAHNAACDELGRKLDAAGVPKGQRTAGITYNNLAIGATGRRSANQYYLAHEGEPMRCDTPRDRALQTILETALRSVGFKWNSDGVGRS